MTNDQDTPGFRTYKALVEKYYPKIDHSTWTKAGYVGATIFGNTREDPRPQGDPPAAEGRRRPAVQLRHRPRADAVAGRPGKHRANKTIYLAQIQRTGDKFAYKYIAGPLVDEYAESRTSPDGIRPDRTTQ